MEKINFPQISGQSDLLDPFAPGRYQYNFFDAWEELAEEYDQKL